MDGGRVVCVRWCCAHLERHAAYMHAPKRATCGATQSMHCRRLHTRTSIILATQCPEAACGSMNLARMTRLTTTMSSGTTTAKTMSEMSIVGVGGARAQTARYEDAAGRKGRSHVRRPLE